MKKVILITGCSSGVGLNTALQFAGHGHTVYATIRDLKKRSALENAAQEQGVNLLVRYLDVEQENSILAVVDEIFKTHGRLDVLVNNAGVGAVAALETMSESDILRCFQTNFFGVIRCIKAVLPIMRAQKSGHILSVSSVGGLVGQPFCELYCSSKFALEGLIESLATYMEPYFGVKFTLVEPAGIKSDFLENISKHARTDASEIDVVYRPLIQTYWDSMNSRGSLDRIAQTAGEVASVIVDAVLQPTQDLRIPTSAVAKSFAQQKLSADPNGLILQSKIRKAFLKI